MFDDRSRLATARDVDSPWRDCQRHLQLQQQQSDKTALTVIRWAAFSAVVSSINFLLTLLLHSDSTAAKTVKTA